MLTKLLGPTHPRTAFATLLLAIAGGMAAFWLQLPLAWLLGSVVAVGLAAALRIPLGPGSADLPPAGRAVAIPLLGAGIGAGFTPDIIAEMPHWWITILALAIYLPLLHLAVYRLLRMTGRVSTPTAFYSAVPGGLVESIQLGQSAGGDVQMMTMLHLLRMISCIVVIPLGLALVSGQDLQGVAPPATTAPAQVWWRSALEIAGMTLAGVAAGRLVRLPAGNFFGPMLVSAILHAAGLSTATLPPIIIVVAQIVIGAGLGARFEGMAATKLVTALWLTALTSVATYGLAVVFAVALGRMSGINPYAVFLAYAPGGIIEMSMIAFAMQISPIFVSAHHLLRIMFAIVGVRLMRPHS